MGKADVFVAPEDPSSRFAKYLGGKPILFDPMDDFEPWFRKKAENAKLPEDEAKAKLEKQRVGHLEQVRNALKKEKMSDPRLGRSTIFGGSRTGLG